MADAIAPLLAAAETKTKIECKHKPPSLALCLLVLVVTPFALAQRGTLDALGANGLYLIAVCWGASLAATISHLTGISFCVLAMIWFGLACVGGGALYMAG